MAKLKLIEDKFYFDAEDGSELIECKEWCETSKKNAAHPEGKMWIKLPKGNVTNRQFFSLDLFNETAVNGEVDVEIKTAAPRVLGATGVKQDIVKYLDEETAAEYTNLVTKAVDAYKAAKASSKAKKLEDMNEEELLAYIDALKSGKKFTTVKTGPKSFMDMFSDEEYARYNEILALAQENKANMPRAKRGPLTDAEKEARAIKRKQTYLTKAEKLLEALRSGSVRVEEEIVDDIDEDLE